MGLARRNAPGPSKYVVRIGIAAILSFAGPGCAGVGSFRGGDYPFLGGFWDYGRSSESLPGGDLYAQQMNEGRAKAAARQANEAGDDRGNTPPAKPAKPDEPTNKADTKPKLSAGAGKARSDQDAIRVTLGRPESLPVVAGIPPDASGKNLVASAAPKWKKESPDRDRETPDNDPDVEPARRRTGPSRTRVASREFAAPAPTREEAPAVLARTNEAKSEDILERAQSKLESLTSYQVSMSRVERVGGRLQPEENVLLSIRRAPKAVRLQWESGPSKGREVIYSTSLDDRVIHVNMPNGALALPRMSIAVDSPLIMRNSRHSIKDAGFDTILSHMSDRPSGNEEARNSSGGNVTYTGKVKPEGFDRPCHRFVRNAPNGERWEVLLDVQSLLPRSVVAHDAEGELLERYTYRDLKENPVELASAEAFDPDSRWGKSKGLFSRLAGAAASVGTGAGSSTTTR